MPMCKQTQNKLNPSKLCKKCYSNKKANCHQLRDNEKNDTQKDDENIIKEKSIANTTLNNEIPNDDINTMEHNPDDRNFIDLIKDNMLKEKKWYEDIQNMLKEQLEFLKQEITVKNSLIESLLTELYNRNNSRAIITRVKRLLINISKSSSDFSSNVLNLSNRTFTNDTNNENTCYNNNPSVSSKKRNNDNY